MESRFIVRPSVRCQYLVRFLSLCWITVGYTIHPPIEEQLPAIGIEPTPFENSASRLTGFSCLPLHPAKASVA